MHARAIRVAEKVNPCKNNKKYAKEEILQAWKIKNKKSNIE